MSHTILSLALGMIFFAVSIQAQNDISSFHKQSNTKFSKKPLKDTQEMLVKSLESGNPQMIANAAQALRDLDRVFSAQSNTILNQFIAVVVEEEGRICGIWNKFLHGNLLRRLKTH
jgi:hypothetical protein